MKRDVLGLAYDPDGLWVISMGGKKEKESVDKDK